MESATIENGSKQTKRKKQTKVTDNFPAKKRNNRFGGLSEEEVLKMGLPDFLKKGLDIVFVGINPGLAAAYAGKYYTGPGNHFWKCLFLSGLVDVELTSKDDYKILDYNYGFTNMVARTTKGSNDLSKEELREGGQIMAEKVRQYRPRIVVFNGKVSYEVFSGKKKFFFGRQEERIGDTRIWVMPSSSARCAQLPRAENKVVFFQALKRYCSYLKGEIQNVDEVKEFVFENVTLKGFPKAKNE